MRIFLSALIVVLISTAAVPFAMGVSTPETPQASVSQDVYLNQIKQDVKDYATLNMAIISNGLTGLGVFTALLAIAAGSIAYFTTRTYRSEIREKKIVFEEFEKEIKRQFAETTNLRMSLSDMVKKLGATESFTKDIIAEAQEKIHSDDSSVLWGKAILAQENKQWDKAYTYWTSILEDDPENDSALFGAALACAELFDLKKKDPALMPLLHEGLQYLQRISYAEISAPVLNRWGCLLQMQADATADIALKDALQEKALNKFRKAVTCDSTNSKAWNNWGMVLKSLAEAATDPARSVKLLEEAINKYRTATECDPKDSDAWNNWGLLLAHQASAETDMSRKVELQEQAMDKYRTATECDSKSLTAWYNWGIMLSKQSIEETDMVRKVALQEQIRDKFNKAAECRLAK